MTTFACVLRSGGNFGPAHVAALYHGFYEHNSSIDFTCLTDDVRVYELFRDMPGTNVVPLEYDTPGWWAKVELFRPEVFPPEERVIYLDLDTVVVGSLDRLVGFDEDAVVASAGGRLGNFASGVMSWRHGRHLETVLPIYLENPKTVRNRYDGRTHRGSRGRHGDQGLIVERVETDGLDWIRAEDVQPGLYRYNLDPRLYRDHELPAGASAVIFSGGRNRPDMVWPDLWRPYTNYVGHDFPDRED